MSQCPKWLCSIVCLACPLLRVMDELTVASKLPEAICTTSPGFLAYFARALPCSHAATMRQEYVCFVVVVEQVDGSHDLHSTVGFVSYVTSYSLPCRYVSLARIGGFAS